MKNFLTIAAMCLATCGPVMAEVDHTFKADGSADIECKCVITNYCQTSISKAPNDHKTNWFRQIVVKKGMNLDLGETCYRKRDDVAVGKLCCTEGPTYETSKKFFMGTVNKEP